MNYKNFFKKCSENNINSPEINELTSKNISIETYNKKLENYEVSNLITWIVKAIINNKKVEVKTEKFNEEDIIKKLIKNTKNIELETTDNIIAQESIIYQNEYKEDDIKLIQKRMLNLFDDTPYIQAINAIYNINISKRKIINPNNVMEDIHKTYNFYVEAIAQKNEQVTFGINKSSINNDIDIEKVTKEAIDITLSKLNENNFNSGNYKVLIEGPVLSEILNSFIPAFSAENIQKNISFLTDKYQKKVFSDKLTIIEDPTNNNYVGKRLFDDEGSKTKYKVIVENGIFKQKLYDKKSAEKDKIQSTGNYYGNIGVRNLYIKAGSKKKEDLIKTMKKGIVINDVQGLHSGINSTSGNMSIQSEGYYVENGKIIYAIKLFVLVSSIIDLLNSIADISNDLEFNNKNINCPSILLDELYIAK